ncbi:MAG: prepilin-type N-terminal cleavage/methylation domain-containing protein, partial [Planctomycetes bacterium]|nr:prepilin-type N-terminal cleavage/methylation domain-containing protein [Planctomycetota bacterium]
MKAGERAFTLIEMLVVVGLIAILAALLAPSLRNAMEAARALRCLNGHRAIGMGMLQFADSFGGRLPNMGSHLCDVKGSLSWHNILNLTVMGSDHRDYPITRWGQAAGDNAIDCPNAGYLTGQSRHFGLNADLGENSADKLAVTDRALWPGKPYGDGGSSSYCLGARISRARSPSKLITVADINGGGADQFYYSGSSAADGAMVFSPTATPDVTTVANLAFRHGRGLRMSVLYLGGNVAQLTPEARNFRRENLKLK